MRRFERIIAHARPGLRVGRCAWRGWPASRAALTAWRPRPFASFARVLLLLFALSSVSAGCRTAASRKPEPTMPERPIVETLAAHTPELMRLPGVVGTYQGALPDGTPCITVMVVRSTPELRRAIPTRLEGHPVVIEETGSVHAMPDSSR